jgi:plasmid stabilization system protein ParE
MQPLQRTQEFSRERLDLILALRRIERRLVAAADAKEGRFGMAAWSRKDRRMYEHIKEGAEDRGAGEDRAQEVAARTVNKRRRKEGRTPNRTSQGTGNPRRSLEDRTKQELYNRAKELHIEGRSKMNKGELVEAIQSRG